MRRRGWYACRRRLQCEPFTAFKRVFVLASNGQVVFGKRFYAKTPRRQGRQRGRSENATFFNGHTKNKHNGFPSIKWFSKIVLTTKHTKSTKENQSRFFVYFVCFVVIQKGGAGSGRRQIHRGLQSPCSSQIQERFCSQITRIETGLRQAGK